MTATAIFTFNDASIMIEEPNSDALLVSLAKFKIGQTPETKDTPKAATTKKTEAKKDDRPIPQEQIPDEAAGKSAAQATEAAADPAKTEIKYEQIQKAIVDLVKAKGKPVAIALLDKHGVTKGPELKPEQYDAFHTAALEAMV